MKLLLGKVGDKFVVYDTSKDKVSKLKNNSNSYVDCSDCKEVILSGLKDQEDGLDVIDLECEHSMYGSCNVDDYDENEIYGKYIKSNGKEEIIKVTGKKIRDEIKANVLEIDNIVNNVENYDGMREIEKLEDEYSNAMSDIFSEIESDEAIGNRMRLNMDKIRFEMFNSNIFSNDINELKKIEKNFAKSDTEKNRFSKIKKLINANKQVDIYEYCEKGKILAYNIVVYLSSDISDECGGGFFDYVNVDNEKCWKKILKTIKKNGTSDIANNVYNENETVLSILYGGSFPYNLKIVKDIIQRPFGKINYRYAIKNKFKDEKLGAKGTFLYSASPTNGNFSPYFFKPNNESSCGVPNFIGIDAIDGENVDVYVPVEYKEKNQLNVSINYDNFKFEIEEVKNFNYLNYNLVIEYDGENKSYALEENAVNNKLISTDISLYRLKGTKFGFAKFSHSNCIGISKDIYNFAIQNNSRYLYLCRNLNSNVDKTKDEFDIIGDLQINTNELFYDCEIEKYQKRDYIFAIYVIANALLTKINKKLNKHIFGLTYTGFNNNSDYNKLFLDFDNEYLLVSLLLDKDNYLETSANNNRLSDYYSNVYLLIEKNETYNKNISLLKEVADYTSKITDTKLAVILNTIQIASIVLTILGWLLVIFESNITSYIGFIILFTLVSIVVSVFIQFFLTKRN